MRSLAVAILAPNLAYLFQTLRVAAAVREGRSWRVVHSEPNLIAFEMEHGVDSERYRYNERCLAEARRAQKAVLGEHVGLSDLFVPIVADDAPAAFLITGPFLTARPTAADVLSRWHRITGRQGHPEDPEFSYYLSMTLETLVLEGPRVALFQRFATLVARIMASGADARALLPTTEKVHRELEEARFVEQIWDAVRTMIDERTSRIWSSPHGVQTLARYGLSRPGDLALVGLTMSRKSGGDPVDEVVRRDAFQRACVDLGRRAGDLLSGRVGNHGVVFLSSTRGSPQRQRQRLLDLGDRMTSLARRKFDFDLYMGVSTLPGSALLCEHYEAALEAAESALSKGVRIVSAAPDSHRPSFSFRRQRKELAEVALQHPNTLPVRFDRYIETVALRCGYRLELVRAHLEAGFERIADALLDRGALEERTFDDVSSELERAARRATTVGELFAAFRHVVAATASAMEHPQAAHREHRMARAIAYIHRHYGEPLSLRTVARVAGLAPGYFAERFKERERSTFGRYLQRLRIERAKHLLASTNLAMSRVAALSGFSTQQYFARVFRRAVGQTPLACRRQLQNVHRQTT